MQMHCRASGRCVTTAGTIAQSRIMAEASVVRGVGSDYPFTPLSFAHRDFVDRRESPTPHCSDVAQNVSNLRSGVIESLRALHDEIGAAALSACRPAPGRLRRLGLLASRCRAQKVPVHLKEFPGSPQKISRFRFQGIFTNPLKLCLF